MKLLTIIFTYKRKLQFNTLIHSLRKHKDISEYVVLTNDLDSYCLTANFYKKLSDILPDVISKEYTHFMFLTDDQVQINKMPKLKNIDEIQSLRLHPNIRYSTNGHSAYLPPNQLRYYSIETTFDHAYPFSIDSTVYSRNSIWYEMICNLEYNLPNDFEETMFQHFKSNIKNIVINQSEYPSFVNFALNRVQQSAHNPSLDIYSDQTQFRDNEILDMNTYFDTIPDRVHILDSNLDVIQTS